MSKRSALVLLGLASLLSGWALDASADPGTREDRAALFDYLLEKTLAREAFSPVKNRRLSVEVDQAMLRYRDELLAADTDEKLYYALVKISNARKDRHLTVDLVEDGLTLSRTAGIQLSNYPDREAHIPHAPIRFAVDYGTRDAYFVFVADHASDIADHTESPLPRVGDRLVSINDQSLDEYRRAIEPYHRYSTIEGFWDKFALWIPQRTDQFPSTFYREDVTFGLERPSGDQYQIRLPYLPPDSVRWEGHGQRRYKGFDLVFSCQTFDFYRASDAAIVLLSWHGFREDLVKDVDRLMDYAVEYDLLQHAVIWDGTRSRGGSKGAYALQRLSPKPFRATYGNLRISDITAPFLDAQRERYEEGRLLDGGVTETLDDGTWLMDWLETDVSAAVARGDAYSTNVPFKLAHLPRDSDGTLQPAAVHFEGPLVVLLGPYGGSHLDQFASMVIDNDLGHTIGMPAGGYSNTWEWEETLIFPLSKKPVVRYMWSIGHTIRPNGEVLEGNPAQVDDLVPVTRANYATYYDLLVEKARRHIAQ